jgi:hypothetical protein
MEQIQPDAKMKMELGRLKNSNAKLQGKVQTYKIAVLVLLSVSLSLMVMLLAKGFIVMPSSPKNSFKAKPIETIYADTLYLYGLPPQLEAQAELFCVMIGAYANTDISRFDKNLTQNVRQISVKGINQIAIGLFGSQPEAMDLLAYIKTLGFKDAYVMKVRNSRRIGDKIQ